MCRLLGVVSATAQPLTALLRDDLAHFTALSSTHCDGWGVSHWDGEGELALSRAPEVAQSSDAYHRAVADAHTDAAVLHLRKASVGMVNTELNTHPFVAGQVAFAHNGWASDAAALDAALLDADGPACRGTTDSERYFGLVLAAMRRAAPETALTAVAARLQATMPVESLNCLMLTEDSLYAFSSYDDARPTATGRNPVETYQLGFRTTADSVVVASSGWEHSAAPWELLPNGQVLQVHRRSLHLTVHRVPPAHALEAVGWAAVAADA